MGTSTGMPGLVVKILEILDGSRNKITIGEVKYHKVKLCFLESINKILLESSFEENEIVDSHIEDSHIEVVGRWIYIFNSEFELYMTVNVDSNGKYKWSYTPSSLKGKDNQNDPDSNLIMLVKDNSTKYYFMNSPIKLENEGLDDLLNSTKDIHRKYLDVIDFAHYIKDEIEDIPTEIMKFINDKVEVTLKNIPHEIFRLISSFTFRNKVYYEGQPLGQYHIIKEILYDINEKAHHVEIKNMKEDELITYAIAKNTEQLSKDTNFDSLITTIDFVKTIEDETELIVFVSEVLRGAIEAVLPFWAKAPVYALAIYAVTEAHKEKILALYGRFAELNSAFEWLDKKAPTTLKLFIAPKMTEIGSFLPGTPSPYEISKALTKDIKSFYFLSKFIIKCLIYLKMRKAFKGVAAKPKFFDTVFPDTSKARKKYTKKDYSEFLDTIKDSFSEIIKAKKALSPGKNISIQLLRNELKNHIDLDKEAGIISEKGESISEIITKEFDLGKEMQNKVETIFDITKDFLLLCREMADGLNM